MVADAGAPYVARLRVFPFKSLRGADVERATVLSGGALRHDREFALYDEAGTFVNGKRDVRVYALRVAYDAGLTRGTFSSPVAGEFTFNFDDETTALERYLARHFGQRIVVRRDAAAGFPDDTKAPGPTLVSTATLATVAAWFPELDTAAVRDRFRSNIELGATDAFWEDRLFGEAGQGVAFRIGTVGFEGTNPCARCVVPSRDAETGEVMAAFAKRVAERRAATLPPWANRARFDHFYRIAVNTRVAATEAGKSVALGDTLGAAVSSR